MDALVSRNWLYNMCSNCYYHYYDALRSRIVIYALHVIYISDWFSNDNKIDVQVYHDNDVT